MTTKALLGTAALALVLGIPAAVTSASAQSINLGHLADYSGATSDVGTPFGQGVADAFAWVNKNGGIDGKKVNVDTVDYGYRCRAPSRSTRSGPAARRSPRSSAGAPPTPRR